MDDHEAQPQPGASDTDTPSSIADYRVIGRLGDGGHGRFFLATPPSRLGLDAEHVVVKVVESVDDDAFQRFTRELKLFSRVASSHLITLYDAGQHENGLFYSMEHCRGGSLAAAGDELDRDQRLQVVATVARAAHDLHEAGIVHRDIRPGNALVRSDRSACLSDLGLAKFGGGSLTSMAPMSSIGFVDPALIRGDSASRSTDIYSIGALLHFALTRQSVHPSAVGVQPMMAVRNVLRHPPHIDREHVTGAEADLIAACIADDLDARPATAAEVAEAVDALTSSSGSQ